MSSKTKNRITTNMGPILIEHFNLTTKIAILSFHNRIFSNLAEILIVLIEYLQLISQMVFLISESTIIEAALDEKPLWKALIFICQLFNPLYYLGRTQGANGSLFTTIFLLSILYLLLKLLLLMYIVANIMSHIKSYKSLINIWRWIFKTQARVLYLIFSSFWMGIIWKATKGSIGAYLFGRTTVIILSSVMVSAEYAGSLYFLMRYCYILPTKNFLAEKDNYIQVINLSQKLILQLLQILLPTNAPANAWIFPLVCLMTDFIRNYHYFKTLPLYNIKALFYQCTLLMVLTSLSICWIAQVILKGLNYGAGEFIWVEWIVLTIFASKIAQAYLQRFICSIVTDTSNLSAELAIHKMIMIRQIRKLTRSPMKYNHSFDFLYLLRQTVNTKIQSILLIDQNFSEKIVFDIDSKEPAKKMFLYYLDTLQTMFPKSHLVRLFVAYFSAKKFKLYGKAMKIFKDLEKSNQRLTRLNISLLKIDLENMIRSRYTNQSSYINTFLFLKSQSLFIQVKQIASNQIDLQIQLFKEIVNESQSVVKILDLAQKICKIQSKIEKKIAEMFQVIPDYFIEPVVFLTQYYFFANNSLSDALKYRKLYYRKYDKYKKFFEKEDLQEENAYQSTNSYIILSGDKSDAGTVLYSSKSIKTIYGLDQQAFVGRNCNILATPTLQSLSYQAFKEHLQDEGESNFSTKFRAFGGNTGGYMVEIDYYMNVYPFVNEKFCLCTLIRKAPTNRDCFLINRNGDIEGVTKNIKEKLGLSIFHSSKIFTNVELVSEELSKVNKAFNDVSSCKRMELEVDDDSSDIQIWHKLEKHKSGIKVDLGEKNDLEKAKDLSTFYRAEGKELPLKSLENNKLHYYHCKFLDIFPEDRKLIICERAHQTGEEEKVQSGPKETKLNNLEENSSENSNFFKSEDERESLSEIGPPPITTDRSSQMMLVTANKLDSERLNSGTDNVFSPLSPAGSGKIHTEASGPMQNIANNRKKVNKKADDHQIYRSFQVIEEEDDINQEKQEFEENLHQKFAGAEGSVAESSISNNTKELKLSNAFKAAIAVKSYPKCSQMACFLYYIILASVLGIQIYIKEGWTNNISALKVKKDIISNAYLRSYLVVGLPAYLTILLGIENGKLDFNSLNFSPKDMYFNFEEELKELNLINNALASDINSLSQNTRKSLFKRDVRVFELCRNCLTQPFIQVNNFEATNSAIEFALRLEPRTKLNITAASDEIDLFAQNCLNDLVLKVAEIAQIFSVSLDEQREEILVIVRICLIVTICLLVLTGIAISINIWNHYFTEKQNMLSILKLNPLGIEHATIKLKNLKEKIDNQDTFEDILFNQSDSHKPSAADASTGTKKILLSTPNTKGLTRKYYFYTTRLAIVITMLTGMVFWNTKTIEIFIEDVYQQQSQLSLINLTRLRIRLVTYAVNDLASHGTDRIVENMPILTFLSNSINEIIDIKSKIPDIFNIETLDNVSEDTIIIIINS